MKTSIPPAHEHPFAQYVRILGKGKKGTRSLTETEAYDALSMVLKGDVEDVQLGAFLMLMRVKEESAEELIGFVRAVRQSIAHDHTELAALNPTIDWSSYAGKRRHLPWYLLAIFALANAGKTVFMHGASGHTIDRLYTQDVLKAMGFSTASNAREAQHQLDTQGFCYFPLAQLSPELHRIIELRNTLGLRSPVHTLARLLNPCDAQTVMQGIFHPGYRPVHQEAAVSLANLTPGYNAVAVIKGEAGEIERNPDSECLVQAVHQGQMVDTTWPALFSKRHVKEQTLDISVLKAVWEGDTHHEYGEAAIIGTLAIVLNTLDHSLSQDAAQEQATALWDNRARDFIANAQ